MLYIVLFEDDESRAEMRPRHMADRLAFLEANTAIRGAGPLSDADTGAAAGGLWLVETESLEAVQALYRATRSGRPAFVNRSGCCAGARLSPGQRLT
jgi:uncharacterized protein YciI